MVLVCPEILPTEAETKAQSSLPRKALIDQAASVNDLKFAALLACHAGFDRGLGSKPETMSAPGVALASTTRLAPSSNRRYGGPGVKKALSRDGPGTQGQFHTVAIRAIRR
jgi:hypothetical protein